MKYIDGVPVSNQKTNNNEVDKKHSRDEGNTYLTYPEWFLVFSPDEYAQFVKLNHPSKFPFLTHIKQFWKSYLTIFRHVNKKYKFNSEYHIMIMVIGISTTLEYFARFLYENTIGRIGVFLSANGVTEEEVYGANVAQEYVDFIKHTPWFNFDFYSKFKNLWSIKSKKEGDLFRRGERKIALSIEYLVKAGYGWVIKKATKASFEEPSLKTRVQIKFENSEPYFENVINTNENEVITDFSRYDPFKDEVIKMAMDREDMEFYSIAGNTDIILVSVLVEDPFDIVDNLSEAFYVERISTTSKTRMLLEIKINELAHFVRLTESNHDLVIEHIFDF